MVVEVEEGGGEALTATFLASVSLKSGTNIIRCWSHATLGRNYHLSEDDGPDLPRA